MLSSGYPNARIGGGGRSKGKQSKQGGHGVTLASVAERPDSLATTQARGPTSSMPTPTGLNDGPEGSATR